MADTLASDNPCVLTDGTTASFMNAPRVVLRFGSCESCGVSTQARHLTCRKIVITQLDMLATNCGLTRVR